MVLDRLMTPAPRMDWEPVSAMSVLLPAELRLIVPLFVSVPTNTMPLLLTRLKVPVLVTPDSVLAKVPPAVATAPPLAELKLPPVIDELLSCTTLPLMAFSVPLAPWLNDVPCRFSRPPSARSTLLLVMAAPLLMVMPWLCVAAIVPSLISVRAVPTPI